VTALRMALPAVVWWAHAATCWVPLHVVLQPKNDVFQWQWLISNCVYALALSGCGYAFSPNAEIMHIQDRM
jgi:hypothetical protein